MFSSMMMTINTVVSLVKGNKFKDVSVVDDSLSELLNGVRKDFCMLRDEEWDGDAKSCQDSISSVEDIMSKLNIEVKHEEQTDNE